MGNDSNLLCRNFERFIVKTRIITIAFHFAFVLSIWFYVFCNEPAACLYSIGFDCSNNVRSFEQRALLNPMRDEWMNTFSGVNGAADG